LLLAPLAADPAPAKDHLADAPAVAAKIDEFTAKYWQESGLKPADPADDARYSGWVHRRTAELAGACGAGVYLGDTDFTRRQDRFMSDGAYRRLAAIRAERDPDGRFASYLTCDPAGLNVHG